MKKIISVIVISILLLAIVIAEQIFVDNTLDTLISQIEILDSKITISDTISTLDITLTANNLDKFWTDREKILCLSINHNDLNRVGEQIKKINVYVSQNNKDDCIYEIKVLAFYAESYKHVMELNFQNLL